MPRRPIISRATGNARPWLLPFRARRSDASRRLTAGVFVSSEVRAISAALVEIIGRGFDARLRIAEIALADVPAETTHAYRRVSGGSTSFAEVAAVTAQLAETQAEVVRQLLAKAKVVPNAVLVLGVVDPGLWHFGEGGKGAYTSLCDAARLVELCTLNVIDAFPARDVARGGLGGPVTALAEWFLLRHRERSRLIVDLGRSVRMTYLPAGIDYAAAARVLSFHVGPGTRLLDLLVRQLTGGEQQFDPGGKLAVQGRQIPALVEHWLSDPYLERPLPRWHPWGVRPERFFTESVEMAIRGGWNVRDLLCTATHFIAECVARAAARRLPPGQRIDEIIVTGGGEQNGLLLRQIAARMPGVSLVRLANLTIAGEPFSAACAAVLANMYLDQIPGNTTAITGTEVPRVLGRLSAGSPLQWQALIREVMSAVPPPMPLRAAV